MLDATDPSDNALKMVSIIFCACSLLFTKKKKFLTLTDTPSSTQCIVYNVPVIQAVELSGAHCSRQALHARISRWKSSLSPPNKKIVQDIEDARGVISRYATLVRDSPSEPSPACAQPITPAIAEVIADGPSWLDPDKTLASMHLRKKRTPSEMCRANFGENAKKAYYAERYSKAFKVASNSLKTNLDDDTTRGKRGCGASAIAQHLNETMLTSPNDRKLKPHALRDAVASSRAGLSPATRGRPPTIPPTLCKMLAQQSAMMQVAGEGEASSVKIKCLTEGLVTQTKWEGVFNTPYCWRKTRKLHPEIMNPVRAKINEDRRVEWLTYKNIWDWLARAKDFLISIGMAKDEPGIIREYCPAVICYAQ